MTDRALMPDYLRLFALFGIVVVNVLAMGFPIMDAFDSPVDAGTPDVTAMWLVAGLAYLKTYGLFSFMFGVGLAFQMRSAERRGLPFGTLYRNRMLGLILLGLFHACLFFPFDILVLYGITGSILYLMRHWEVRRLVRVGAILLGVQILIAASVAFAPPLPGEDDLELLERMIMTEGGLIDVTVFRAISFANILPFLLLLQGISALGWFALGLASVKSGLIDQPGHPLWVRARRYCLVPGVVLSLGAAALWQWGGSPLGEALTTAAAPLATLGYLGLIAYIAQTPSDRFAPLLKAGGSSLSIYLGQSILLTLVFAPYGLGLWDRISPALAVVLAVLVTLALMAGLILWRQRFALGPFEAVLRRITRIGVDSRGDRPQA